jgi:outer membrane protein TolC
MDPQFRAKTRTRVVLPLIACGVAASLATSARAQANPALTSDAAIARALSRNPDLLTAQLRVDSAGAERRIAAGLPNPTLSATPGSPSQYAVQLPIDVGPARHFRIRVAGEGVNAARFDVLDARRQVVFNVRQAFYDALLADSLRSLAADQVATFRELLAADSARLASGSIAERDVVATRLQLAHAEAVLARAVVQQHTTRLALEAVSGGTTIDTSLLISGSLAYRPIDIAPDSVVTVALRRRPDYLAAETRVTQSSSALSLARANLIPVPVIGGVYQPAQAFASGAYVAPSIGLTVPVLYAFGGERARARSSLAAARVQADRTALQIRADVTLAFDGYRSARELADRYACGLLVDAAGALEAARYAYTRGATALPDLLEAVRAYADTRSDYLTAVHDYWVSIFALERATGIDFVPAAP